MVGKKFTSGFTSWQETHYEVVAFISRESSAYIPQGIVSKVLSERGYGGLYELAENLTDEFEELYIDREWDGDFFDEIEAFLNEKLYKL